VDKVVVEVVQVVGEMEMQIYQVEMVETVAHPEVVAEGEGLVHQQVLVEMVVREVEVKYGFTLGNKIFIKKNYVSLFKNQTSIFGINR